MWYFKWLWITWETAALNWISLVVVLFNVTECQVLLFLILVLFIFFNHPNTEIWPVSLVGARRNRCMRNFRTGFKNLCCCWNCFMWSSENGNVCLKLSYWLFHLCLQWRRTDHNTWKQTLKTVISHFSFQGMTVSLFKVPGCSLVNETMINALWIQEEIFFLVNQSFLYYVLLPKLWYLDWDMWWRSGIRF